MRQEWEDKVGKLSQSVPFHSNYLKVTLFIPISCRKVATWLPPQTSHRSDPGDFQEQNCLGQKFYFGEENGLETFCGQERTNLGVQVQVRFLVLDNTCSQKQIQLCPFPTGLGLGAADRKIRDLHVRGFCHSSEYISYGSEYKHGIEAWGVFGFYKKEKLEMRSKKNCQVGLSFKVRS